MYTNLKMNILKDLSLYMNKKILAAPNEEQNGKEYFRKNKQTKNHQRLAMCFRV